MNKILKEKIKEAFSSVLPITTIVLAAGVTLTTMPSGTVLMFLAGAALLVVGMGFFTLGADMAMMVMGEGIGVQLTKSSKLILVIVVSFLMGVIITVAEPDLQVLAKQVPSIPGIVLILTVALGVGIFLVVAVLRPLLKIRLSYMLIFFYAITFILAFFAPNNFIPVAFDSGGVTTGPITVPFILAMGIGVAALRSDKNSQDDTFGLVALCSVGPILAVLLLGIFYNPGAVLPEAYEPQNAETSRDVARFFIVEIPHFFIEVLYALGAIIIFFIVFQLVSRRYHRHQIGRICVGFLYTLIGLVLFLTGVNVGFIPVGELLGSQIAESSYSWVLIPLGILIGYFIVSAEPAVHVLNKQVEEISGGAVTTKMMYRGLASGMALALSVTMVKLLFHIPIMYILIPGYAIALILTFFVPKIFTGIAFDSGGVCSGPMCTTFLLPFAMGVCKGTGGDLMIEAFGMIAMVAMTPLIVIQIMGLIYKFRSTEAAQFAKLQTDTMKDKAIDWHKITIFEDYL